MAQTESKAFAIIGMAVKLPEAEHYEQFWENLAAGRGSVRELPASRQKLHPAYEPGKEYARFGYIEGIDLFDPGFFKTLPAVAKWIDPAQRLLLEVVNDGIEDAGLSREMLHNKKVGVFLSDYAPEYYKYLSETGLDTLAGNLPANLAGRIAYCNGFTGPALTIDTACSSALVALHLALESMRAGDCEIAVVGGASIKIDLPEKAKPGNGVMSPTGVCRPFAANADGTVGGEGVIAILLKPLEQAQIDRDRIHAVIRGSAINQDGSRSNGLTAPSPVAQTEVIKAAWADAGIDPCSISYMETHGSATRLGDPIEITGLTDAFQSVTQETGFCPIGAVKANIGHLGNVAGLAGLVKTVLSLKHKQIAPMVNCQEVNPLIPFTSAQVFVNQTLQDWAAPYPRRAGVSSFGLSGTNCHIVLEEAPVRDRVASANLQMIAVSAQNDIALSQKLEKLQIYMEEHPEVALEDLAYTLLGQKHSTARFSCVVGSWEELLQKLGVFPVQPTTVQPLCLDTCQAVFLIPDFEPAFGSYYEDFCMTHLPAPDLLTQCRQILNPADHQVAAYFTFAYTLAQMWMKLGIKPQSIIGLGVGELVSAALSKRMSLDEALVKAVALQERPAFQGEKLRQFIQLQISKGRNLFLHFAADSVLGREVQQMIGECAGIYLFHCYGSAGGRSLLETLANLYALGLDLQWQVVGLGQRIALPLSVYQKKSYWFDLDSARRVMKTEDTAASHSVPLVPHRISGREPEPGVNVDMIQEILTQIWLARLGLESVGLDEDFIELGGDSIRAMLLMNDIKHHIGVHLDLAYLLQYGTIAALAQKIQEELLILQNQNGFQEELSHPTEPLEREAGSPGLIQKIGEVPSARRVFDQSDPIPLATPVRWAEGVAYFALSPSQKNLWLVHQIDPAEVAYNEPMALILQGPLQRENLERALQALVNRQASLRTRFTLVNGEPLQGVHDHLTVSIEYLEKLPALPLQNVDPSTELQILEELVHREAAIPFDLNRAPLLRAKLIQLAPERYLFILVVHHIIFDGWSILVLLREICQLYEAFVHEQPDPLPSLPVQYHDFAHWQNQLLQSGQMQKAEEYWLSKLAGELPILDLPSDYPRPAQKRYEGSSHRFQISPEFSRGIKQLSKENGVTLFATMLGVFEILLHKYTGEEEMIIGTPSANRPHDRLWGLIGFFVNTFALRHRISREDTFSTLLKRIKEELMETYAYKDYPFAELVSKLNRKRDTGRSAIFDVMYVFHNVGSIQTGEEKILGSYGDIIFQDLPRREIVSDYDVKIEFEEAPEWFNGKIEYSTHLFTPETIERMEKHLQQVLQEVLANPEQRVGEIDLLTPGEREQLLKWNATEREFADNTTVPAIFREQAEAGSENSAVICGTRQLTYREFYLQAAHIADHLVQRGIGSNQIVGIMVERSLEMLSGVYGISLAGGAYLPLDPQYPDERIEYMLTDSKMQLLLVHENTRRRAEQFSTNVEILVVEELLGSHSGNSAVIPHKSPRPDDLAYIIYTSGSTGKPKGVMIEHRGLVNRLQWMQRMYSLTPDDTILQKTPYTFDVSVWEIFWWSLYGARVALLPPGGEKEPQVILDAIATDRVTTLHFVPSMLSAFLHYLAAFPAERNKLRSLRQVFASGEALVKSMVDSFMEQIGEPVGAHLHNLYGPTEATIDVSYFDCTNPSSGETVPIGRPIDNTILLVVDQDDQLQPIGVPGEIWIGGVGLARGYLNRPELTAEKFVIQPELGQRMYRTGDLGRFLADGNIEFLGRLDHQVKIRGYRIEPGEIEAILAKHPAVREAVVLAKADETGTKTLVACLVMHEEGNSLNLRQVMRPYLLQHVPEYMVPAYFVSLPELPHLSNGKVDRKMLQRVALTEEPSAMTYVAPRNELERSMATIWERILKQPRVGIHDNFFELGGDSIKAIQIVVELDQLGIQMQMNDIMQNQTIDQLSAQILSAGFQVQESAVSGEVYSAPVEGQVPLTPIQHWFFHQSMLKLEHWNQSVLLKLHFDVRSELLGVAMQKILEHHDALRLIYHDRTQTFFYHNRLLDQPFELPVFDLKSLTPEEQNHQMMVRGEELKGRMELDLGPLMKACIFDLGERGRRLLLTVHHLVVDGVSWQILLNDLTLAYQQLAAGNEVLLPEKTDSYKQWAEAVLLYSRSEEVCREIPYWNVIVEKVRAFELPVISGSGQGIVNHADPFSRNATGTYASARLSTELTDLLRTEVHNAFHTNITDFLLTALALTVSDWTNRNEVYIHMENHGRYPVAAGQRVDRTVGWFTAMYPVELKIDGSDLVAALKKVKETLRQIPGNGIGYGILRYLTRVWEEEVPVQILFNYLGQLDFEIPDECFTIAKESTGVDRAGENERSSLLEIVAQIEGGQFQIYFHYDWQHFQPETIQTLADTYIVNLESMIRHCSGQCVGYTPADFDLAGLDQKSLDELSADLESLLEGME